MAQINGKKVGSNLSEIAQTMAEILRQATSGDTIKIEIDSAEEMALKQEGSVLGNLRMILYQLGVPKNSFSMNSLCNGQALLEVIA
jgi:hypothetical protein